MNVGARAPGAASDFVRDTVEWLRLRKERGTLSQYALVPILVGAVVLGAITTDGFFTYDNFLTILQQSSELAIVVLALTIVLIAGRFDLSLESTVGLAPLIAAWLTIPTTVGGLGVGINPYLALVVALMVGALVGAVNAFLIVRLGLNAFIVTLAMLILLRGIHVGLTDAGTLYDLPEPLLFLGTASIGDLPLAVLVAGLLYLVFGLLLRYHRLGRALYAVGGNTEAARAAGINVERVLWGAFILASVLAAVAGLMLTGRLGAVTPDQGENYIFTVFAAAVIGGISLRGGRGTLLGALTGVLLLGIISNLLILSQVPTFWIEAVYGGLILVALIVASFTGGERETTR